MGVGKKEKRLRGGGIGMKGRGTDPYGLTDAENAEFLTRFRRDGLDSATNWRDILRKKRAGEVNAAAEAGQADRTRASAAKNIADYEARMRALYPDWDDYTEDTKRSIANAPFAKKQGELSGSKFAAAIIQGVNDPILRQGIEIASDFLVKGGIEAAKAILKGDIEGGVMNILKKSAPAFAYAFTASHKKLGPVAEAVRAIAEKIAGN